ncbi:MAG: hypothetical protein K2J12_03035 [Muribaculaceae bacterium]|nr:hypothetical protein [Muribaculaceae bacterium]
MKSIIRCLSVLLLLTISLTSYTQNQEEITLIVSSDGPSKDDAVKNALRTALEQAYGAFVSANTTILDDELVKDEIVTISTGAIKEYNIVSESEKPDGKGYMVTTKATVSLPHLISYAKNHGSECEFAGNAFAMQMKLFEIQTENEEKTILNLINTIKLILPNFLKWELIIDEPRLYESSYDAQEEFVDILSKDSNSEEYSETIARLKNINQEQFYEITAQIYASVYTTPDNSKLEKRVKEIMSSKDMKEMMKKRKKELMNSGYSHRLDMADEEAKLVAVKQAYNELLGMIPYSIIKETLDAISISEDEFRFYGKGSKHVSSYIWEYGEDANRNQTKRYFRSDRTPSLLDSLELAIGNAIRDFVIVDNMGNSHYLYPFELDKIKYYNEPIVLHDIIARKDKNSAKIVSLEDSTLFSYPVFIRNLGFSNEYWSNNIIVEGFSRVRGLPGVTRDFNWDKIIDPHGFYSEIERAKQIYTPVGVITFLIPKDEIGKYSSFKIVRK